MVDFPMTQHQQRQFNLHLSESPEQTELDPSNSLAHTLDVRDKHLN